MNPLIAAASVIAVGLAVGLASIIGVFLWIAISSIAPVGLLMSGYGSNNKYYAATMVAAGIFLVARLLPLFIVIPYIMNLIPIV